MYYLKSIIICKKNAMNVMKMTILMIKVYIYNNLFPPWNCLFLVYRAKGPKILRQNRLFIKKLSVWFLFLILLNHRWVPKKITHIIPLETLIEIKLYLLDLYQPQIQYNKISVVIPDVCYLPWMEWKKALKEAQPSENVWLAVRAWLRVHPHLNSNN